MALVKGRGNKSTELRFVALLRSRRISGWRRHTSLPGRPDFTFPAEKVAIFVDGCFWHGCKRCYRRPKSNIEFWAGKLRENMNRDRRVDRRLRREGWKVLRIWEHSLGRESSLVSRLRRALEFDDRAAI